MSGQKTKKTPPSLDMTPLVDLAFLLVTFFMLTTQFRPEEPQDVSIPSSTTESQTPETNIMTVLVADDGRVFFDMDNKFKRLELIQRINDDKNLGLTESEMNTFAIMQGFGMPLNKIKSFLSMESSQRSKLKNNQDGIPVDSANNELYTWVLTARLVNPKNRLMFKADSRANYEKVQDVFNTLLDKRLKLNRFNLLTTAEGGSATQ